MNVYQVNEESMKENWLLLTEVRRKLNALIAEDKDPTQLRLIKAMLAAVSNNLCESECPLVNELEEDLNE